jgi:hypothetical protein
MNGGRRCPRCGALLVWVGFAYCDVCRVPVRIERWLPAVPNPGPCPAMRAATRTPPVGYQVTGWLHRYRGDFTRLSGRVWIETGQSPRCGAGPSFLPAPSPARRVPPDPCAGSTFSSRPGRVPFREPEFGDTARLCRVASKGRPAEVSKHGILREDIHDQSQSATGAAGGHS